MTNLPDWWGRNASRPAPKQRTPMKRLPKIKKRKTPTKKFPGNTVITIRQTGIGVMRGGTKVNRPITGLYPVRPTPPKLPLSPRPPKGVK